MSGNFTLIGALAQPPRGKSFTVAGQMHTNQFGRLQQVPFQFRCVLTNDNAEVLQGLVPGTALMVEGRFLGLQSEPGHVLLLAPNVHILGSLPTTVTDKLHACATGVNFATLGANVASAPVTEEFRGDQLRVTFLAEFNNRKDTVKVVCMGSSAHTLRHLQVGDRVNLTGHLAQEVSNDPLGRSQQNVYFEAARADTENAAAYLARTTRPRKGKNAEGGGRAQAPATASGAPTRVASEKKVPSKKTRNAPAAPSAATEPPAPAAPSAATEPPAPAASAPVAAAPDPAPVAPATPDATPPTPVAEPPRPVDLAPAGE